MKTSGSNSTGFPSRIAAAVVLSVLVGISFVLLNAHAFGILGYSVNTKATGTRAALATIKNAIAQYNLEQSAYPPDLEALVKVKILEPGKLTDRWKRPLIYRPTALSPERPFVLFSLGPDGKPLTQDDIDAWESENHKRE